VSWSSRRGSRKARRSARRRIAAIALWALVGGTGCQLFMDLDVDGYDAAPAPKCGGDAACVSINCISQGDCDGGVCCLTVNATSTVVASVACQQGACDTSGIQLCLTDAECGTSGSCSPCTVGGFAVHVCSSPVTSVICSP
jgi:hypothetical protein